MGKSRIPSSVIFCALVLVSLSCPVPAAVVINEIMYHPASEDVNEEYIELLNTGPFSVNLQNWALTTGVRFTFPSWTLAPGGTLVVAADLPTFTNLYPGVDNVLASWDGVLSNRGETLTLEDALSNRIDRVAYADRGDWARREVGVLDNGHRGWTWAAGHDGEGASLELQNPALPNDSGQNWASSKVLRGTPGAPNTVATNNIPPLLLEAQHIPPIPDSTDPVTVVVRLLDELPTGVEVILHHRVDGEPAFETTPLADDGQSNDGLAGDGTWGVVLPPQPDDTVVEFYLRAADSGGRVRTWPGSSTQPAAIIGRWHLDETSGTLAADASGRAVDGVLTNGAVFSSAGILGGAVELDGIDDAIRLEGDIGLVPPLGVETFTVAAWFKRTGDGLTTVTSGSSGVTAEPLVTKGRTEQDGDRRDLNFFLGLAADGTNRVLGADFEEHVNGANPGRNHPVVGSTAIPDQEWHHAAVTYNGAALILYLDGVLDASISVSQPPNFESIQPAAIGTTYNSLGEADGAFHGLIDEVVIFDQALTADEVAALVAGNTYVPGPGGNDANLLYQVDDDAYTGDASLARLIMTEAERAELDALGNGDPDARSHAQMNGTFISRDSVPPAVRYNVGIRNRGEGSRTANPNNRRVNFPGDRTWKGLHAVNFNSRYTHAQIAGSVLAQRAGLVTARARRVQVRENNADLSLAGSPMYGAYAQLEVVDSDFADAHFPGDGGGNIYQGRRNWPANTSDADLSYRGEDFGPYLDIYNKRTNTSEADWSDIVDLTYVLSTNTPDAAYAAEVARVLDVSQWFRFLAVSTLFDNDETNISNGDGDDYHLYRGVLDSRFVLVPHDFDTVLGEGTSSATAGVFRFLSVPALERLFKWPDFAPLYYGHLVELMDTVFTPEVYDSLIDRSLDDLVPASVASRMKGFARTRIDHVRSQIPLALTATTGLPVANGYPRSTSGTADLAGEAHAVSTRAVQVNGSPAAWVAWEGTWSYAGLALQPGINRVVVESLDAGGVVTERSTLDIWSDTGPGTTVSGTLATDQVWQAASGPYLTSGSITVPAGTTLTIEPGTTLLFGAGHNLTVEGRLVAEGTDYQRIRMAPAPGSGTTWDGLRFIGTTNDNRLAYADIDGAQGGGEAMLIQNSTLLIDHVNWTGVSHTVLELADSSVRVQHSVFPAIDNSESIHGAGIPPGGYLIIESNVFGITTGYSDIIDFSGAQRPGPILQVLGNRFLGGSDDGLDLDGCDAHIEGNVFMHFQKNNTSDSSCNAIATGLYGGNPSFITVARNVFFDVDHAILLKEGSHLTSQHNTYVGSRIAAIHFDEPERDVNPGLGADLDGDVFWNHPTVFENVYTNDPVKGTVALTANRCMLPAPYLALGVDNDERDPRLVNPTNDFHLGVGSPAIGTGPNELDRGAYVPAGAAVSGQPASPTRATQATVNVGGPGITHYRYRVNNEPYSSELPVGTPISLIGLTNGTYTVSVLGKNSAAVWQDASRPTLSRSWTVDGSHARLVINEVLADNATAVAVGGLYPDLIELYNDSPQAIDLGGMRITDRAGGATGYVFPPNTLIDAGGYRVLWADSAVLPAGIHLGFALRRGGEGVYLYDAVAGGGGLIDSVVFGPQIPDHSIARDRNGDWSLAEPTLGSANLPIATGDPATLRINEWLAEGGGLFPDDFIELYNPDPLPVALGGLFLSDDIVARPDRHAIPPLSFIPARGVAVFYADGNPVLADHVGFKLASEEGWIGLYDPSLQPIDIVYYGQQQADRSEGRSPSGSDAYAYFNQPNPGAGNPGAFNRQVDTMVLVPYTHTWKYDQTRTDLGSAWREPDYDDSSWPAGPGLLYYETSALPEPKNTPLDRGPDGNRTPTIYFRTEFVFAGNPAAAEAEFATVIDDGAVVYLNGVEIRRLGFPSTGPVVYGDFSTRSIGNADYEGPFSVPPGLLVTGTNVLAVEIHQVNATSSDIVMGLSLTVSETRFDTVVLNEVLARNDNLPTPHGTYPDWVELYSTSAVPVDLSGLSLTDDLANPGKWVFPAGTYMPSNGYLVVYCDSLLPASTTNTGFGFDWEGDGVYLFDSAARGGALLDGIFFGLQVPDYSLARVPDGSGDWALAIPTPTVLNQPAALGDPGQVKLNEWMADPETGEDWFELFNPGSLPVPLAGVFLTDDLLNRTQYQVSPLSFLGAAAAGYKKFLADNNPALGVHHTSFKLAKSGEPLGLFSPDLVRIDALAFGAQTTGVSEGRLPDGTDFIVKFPLTASPEASNYGTDADGDGLPDAWESRYGDATLDPDGDGASNRDEFLSGTDPLDAGQLLQVEALLAPGLTLRFPAVLGKSYVVEWTDDPGLQSWDPLQLVPPQDRSRALDIHDSTAAGKPRRFYRVRTPAP